MTTPDANPYNCSSPGNLFVGYDALRQGMRRGLRDGKSYALLGGRRCGKTSLLLRLAEDLRAHGLAPFQVLPRFLDIQALVPHSPFEFFSRVYALATEGLGVEPWTEPPPRQHYDAFLARMDGVRARLEQARGPRWLVVLLIDELDAAPAKLPDDECFQNLRNLLTASPYRSHFRVVASGCSSMGSLIGSSSPLNNLDPEYTRPLLPEEARTLIAAGFPEGLGPEAERDVLQRTGRHPYALQGLLGLLWEQPRPLAREASRRAAARFSRDRLEIFKTWREDLGEEGRACLEVLARAGDAGLGLRELRSRLAPGRSLDDGLRTLSYHGLIDEDDPDHPRVAGTFFTEWFLHGLPDPAPPMTTPERTQVFISYSHKDKTWLDKLETHLKPRIRNGRIDAWNDKRLRAGDTWHQEITDALARTKVAVLLVSPDFVASDFIVNQELAPFLEAAKQGQVKILWVPLKASAFLEVGLGEYQAVLDPSRPLNKRHHAHVGEALEEVCTTILAALAA